jgi:N,N'-diacetylbacillosaminyl-diphospho-undecaprenol alpha-1,3-N-acetylgalactosaminyltransferase
MKTLVEQGHEVLLLAPKHDKYTAIVKSIGVKYIPVDINRFTSPLRDIKLIFSLYKIFKLEKPDIVHNFTIKPNVYGTIAAKMAGIKRIVFSITGLGYLYSEEYGLGLRTLRIFADVLYMLASRLCDKVSFQNDDDLNYFVSRNVVKRDKAVLIRGSGVNLDEFNPLIFTDEYKADFKAKQNIEKKVKVVSMVARANWSKGVREFIEASKILERRVGDFIFLLIGPIDEGPLAVPEQYLRKEENTHFRWMGFQEDVRSFLAISDIVVLPSYYREGIPRSLIEAISMGKPVVTTDNVGCREIVDPGSNGYIVSIKDVQMLVEYIDLLLKDENKTISFGYNSRKKAEQEFSEDLVVRQTLENLYNIVTLAGESFRNV